MPIITPGELFIGVYVTVYEVNYLDDKKKWNENSHMPVILLPTPQEYGDYTMYEKMKGITLQVVSIQLPYLAVRVINDEKVPVIAIDTRKCMLMELNKDFVESFKR